MRTQGGVAILSSSLSCLKPGTLALLGVGAIGAGVLIYRGRKER